MEITRTEIQEILKDCVFYPCSGLDGTPVRFLSSEFQSFVYVDYSISKEQFVDGCENRGFYGYTCRRISDLQTHSFFGSGWEARKEEFKQSQELFPNDYDSQREFVALATFDRNQEFDDLHGPKSFSLILACCEATSAFTAIFSANNIAPRCLCYIRPGIGFGGSSPQFPRVFSNSIVQNPVGLPPLLLIDHKGASMRFGDYLPLVNKYKLLIRFPYQTEGYGMSSLILGSLDDGAHGRIPKST